MNNVLVRWDPFRDLASLHNRLDRLFDGSLRGLQGGQREEALEGTAWAPER